jgi:hypothetical protein
MPIKKIMVLIIIMTAVFISGCVLTCWLRLRKALSKIAPKVAVPMPPMLKPPRLRVKLPAPSTSVTATIIRLPLSPRST